MIILSGNALADFRIESPFNLSTLGSNTSITFNTQNVTVGEFYFPDYPAMNITLYNVTCDNGANISEIFFDDPNTVTDSADFCIFGSDCIAGQRSINSALIIFSAIGILAIAGGLFYQGGFNLKISPKLFFATIIILFIGFAMLTAISDTAVSQCG